MTDRLESLAARGVLAGGVAAELAEPLRRIQSVLADTVDLLDQHVAASTGPAPLSWEQVGRLREQVAEAYLELGRVARLAGDLAAVTSATAGDREVDVNDLVERAVALARHRLGDDGEIMLDLGTLPRVGADPARLVQAIAHVLLMAVDEAGPQATLVVTTVEDEGGGARVIVTHPLGPAPVEAPSFWPLIEETIASVRGTVAQVRSASQVSVDVRIPAASR